MVLEHETRSLKSYLILYAFIAFLLMIVICVLISQQKTPNTPHYMSENGNSLLIHSGYDIFCVFIALIIVVWAIESIYCTFNQNGHFVSIPNAP